MQEEEFSARVIPPTIEVRGVEVDSNPWEDDAHLMTLLRGRKYDCARIKG
jgi:hypothetical protein